MRKKTRERRYSVASLLYERRKKKHGGDRKSKEAKKSSGQNDHLKSKDDKTSDKVSSESSVGEKIIRRHAEYARAVDALIEAFCEYSRGSIHELPLAN